MITLDVPPGQTPDIRIDVYVTSHLQNVTRTRVKEGIKTGMVTVNGKSVKASYLVQPLDHIECVIMRPPPIEAQPEDIPLDIIFEDEVLIVVNKAAGMVVHPAYGNRTGTLVNALLHHTDSKLALRESDEGSSDDAGAVRPGLVHRLDKDTSGLMVVAKTDAALAHLGGQFADRTIDRLYEAVVWGLISEPSRVDARLGRDPRDRKKMAVVMPPAGKVAITNLEPIEPLANSTLVRFKLETGRTHQIRVHATHIGHPVFADATYDGNRVRVTGLSKTERRFYMNRLEQVGRQALHAKTLGFIHPVTRERLSFECPLAEDMQKLVDALRKHRRTSVYSPHV